MNENPEQIPKGYFPGTGCQVNYKQRIGTEKINGSNICDKILLIQENIWEILKYISQQLWHYRCS